MIISQLGLKSKSSLMCEGGFINISIALLGGSPEGLNLVQFTSNPFPQLTRLKAL